MKVFPRPTKTAYRWWTMLVCILAVTPLAAQSQASFDQQLTNLWADYLAAKAIGDEDGRAATFESMKRLRQANLGDIFERAAYLFLEEGQRDLLLGKYDSARQEYLHAVDMNPHLWPAYAGLAHIRYEQDGNIRQYLNLNTKGFSQAFTTRNTFFFLEAAIWCLQNFYRGFQLVVALFTLLLCVRRVRTFLTTVQHGFSQKAQNLTAELLSMALLVAPLLLGAHFYLAALLYLALFLPFFSAPERKVALIIFVLAVLLPILNVPLANLNYARSNPQLEAHLTQFVAGDLDTRIEFLESQTSEGELAHRTALILGLLYNAKGNQATAFRYFSQVPPISDYWPEAQVNMGNLRFGAKEFQEAIDYYTKANNARPEMFSALFNMAVANARLGDHRQAETLKEQAARVDAQFDRRPAVYENLQVANVFDATPKHGKRLWTAMSGSENPATDGWFTKPDFILPIGLTLLLLILGLVHVNQRNPVLIALQCTKCGRIFFPSDSPNNKWCNQCVSIYIRKEDLPSEAKLKKVDEVGAYTKKRRWINRISQVLLPGAKQVQHDHPLSGFFTLFIWCLLLVFVFMPVKTIEHTSMEYLQTNILSYITITVAAIYWIFFALVPVFQED